MDETRRHGVELIEQEAGHLLQMGGPEKRLGYSQKGTIIGFVTRGSTELKSQRAQLKVMDWKSSTNKRLIGSSFAAEIHAAPMCRGVARFCQVVLNEIRCGGQLISAVEDDGWQRLIPLGAVTGCKRVYDTVHCDRQHVFDKGRIVNEVLLRQLLATRTASAKTKLLCVPPVG